MAVTVGEINAEIGLKLSKFEKGLDRVEKDLKGLDRKIKTSTKSITGFTNAIAGIASTTAIIGFGKQIINVRSEFERFEAVLTNTLGSGSAAQGALNQIKQFASETPFSVQELTDSFVRLANQGFVPTKKEMQNLGDLAASTGKRFDQLAEAIIDAQTGEFERLKEFGIRASKQGEQVEFTFKGVKKQVDFTSDSIQQYILSLGELEGVTGSMNAISKTLGGSISNVGDSFDNLLMAISNTNGALNKFIANFGETVNAIAESIRKGYLIGVQELRASTKSLENQVNISFSKITNSVEQGEKTWKEWAKSVDNSIKNQEELLKNSENLSARQKGLIKDQINIYEQLALKIKQVTTVSGQSSKKNQKQLQQERDLLLEMLSLRALEERAIGVTGDIVGPQVDQLNLEDLKEIPIDFEVSGVERLPEARAFVDELIERGNRLNDIWQVGGDIFMSFGQALTDGFQSAIEGSQSFGEAIGQFLKQLVSRLIAATLAAAALSLLLSSIGFGSGTSFGAIFGQLSGFGKSLNNSVPQLAEGGIITAPTLAMIGEKAGSRGEAVIPLEKLGDFTGSSSGNGNLKVTFGKLKASGEDLVVTEIKATNTRNKFYTG